jgi:Family of unknown function (DUF5681)
MGEDSKSGYRVGYGKPPLHTRFKPGNRANPRGRPRRSDGLALQLFAALDEAAEVEDADGKRRKIAKRRLGIARLADGFAAGDPHATRIVLDLILQIEGRMMAEAAPRPPAAAADRAVIANFIARLRRP